MRLRGSDSTTLPPSRFYYSTTPIPFLGPPMGGAKSPKVLSHMQYYTYIGTTLLYIHIPAVERASNSIPLVFLGGTEEMDAAGTGVLVPAQTLKH